MDSSSTTSISENVLLAYPQFYLPFIVATDASDVGIAAVLSQVINGQERPIAFYSRSLRRYEKNFTISEKEALAVVVRVPSVRCISSWSTVYIND